MPLHANVLKQFRPVQCSLRWAVAAALASMQMATVAPLLLMGSREALGNPVGEKVIAGSAAIQRSGNTLTVNQGSDRAIINWQGFSIGVGELTKFVQPGAASATLNRVVSGNPSALLGRLEANGKVFLINPNGILVGGGAVINTNSFVASTLDVSNAQFSAGGDLNFVGDSKAGIQNLGTIKAQDGDVFLIGHSVENAGALEAAQGTVGLAAGNDVLLRHAGDQRLFVQATVPGQSAIPSGVTNAGVIAAVQAELHAGSGNVYSLAVNNSGAIQATGIIEKNGRVLLTSSGGSIENSGSIVARNANGDGGAITLADVQQSTGQSTVTSSGVIDASGLSAASKGGSVTISGYRAALDGHALVDVSGDAGGGAVLLGGDYQGRNGAADNAQITSVGQSVRINADAVTRGAGGKVIVWADQSTTFNGHISARGGAAGGDGGLIETSGKVGLTVGKGARADASAAMGKPGVWLLDPTNFTIVSGAGDLDAGPPYTPSADENTIDGADIAAALAAGTDVTISTASAFAGAGNVTFNGDILPGTSRATLRVMADNDINVNSTLGGTSANNQFIADFQAAGNIAVNSGGFIGARNVMLTAQTGSITLNGAVHAVGEFTGGQPTGADGNMTLSGAQGVSTGLLSGSAFTVIAKNRLTVNSSAGSASLLGKTEAKELAGTVNANFIQSRGNTSVSTSSTIINTLKSITSEGGRIDIDNFGSLAIDGAISAAGANQNVSIRTIGDMNFLSGASITTSATGTTSLTTLANPFASTPPAGNISSTSFGNTTPVVKGGGALVLRPLGSAGFDASNPLYTAVSQLEAEPSFGGVFIHNTGGTLFIGTNAASRDPDAAALGVRVNTTTTSQISIVNEGSIQVQSPTGERVVGPGDVTLRALGANSDIFIANVNANGVSSRNGKVTLNAGHDVNIGMQFPNSQAGNIIGATGVDLTAGNQIRIIRGSSVLAQGTGSVNATASIIEIDDLGPVATRIQTQGGAINLTTRLGGQIFLHGSAGGGLFTTLVAGRSGNINLAADWMLLESRIDAGTANATFAPQTANRPISIAFNSLATPDQGMLVIPDAALDRVTAGTLSIGGTFGNGSAGITVNEAISRPTSGPTYATLKLFYPGNIDIASPIDIGGGDLILSSVFNVLGSGNLTANTLNVAVGRGTINLSGNITAAQRLDASSAGNMTFGGNINSNRLNLTSSSGSISLTGEVSTLLFAASASGGNVTVNGAHNNILVVSDVSYGREFRLNTSANGLAIAGAVDGAHTASATIEVRNGGLILASGSRFFFGDIVNNIPNELRLFSDTSFENQAGAGVLVAENGGRWLIYAPSPEVTHLGGLAPAFTAFSVNYPAVPGNAGNGVVHASAAAATPPPPPPPAPSASVHSSDSPYLREPPSVLTAPPRYKTLGLLDGPFLPSAQSLLGAVELPDAAFYAKNEIAIRMSERRGYTYGRSDPSLTRQAMNGIFAVAGAAHDSGSNYEIRAVSPNAGVGDFIARPRIGDGTGSLYPVTVVFDDGRRVAVPYGGRVVADGRGGVEVLADDGTGILAVGKGTVIAFGGADTDLGSHNSDELFEMYAIIDEARDAQLAARGVKIVQLPTGRRIPMSVGGYVGSYALGKGGAVSPAQIYAIARESGLSPDDVSAMVAAGGGNLTAGVVAAMVAAGGGNMNGTRIARMVAAGGGNMVAAGGGNMVAAGAGNMVAAGAGNLVIDPRAVAAIISASMVAAGGGNMVAAGAGNMVAAGGGNMVAAGGGNLAAQVQQMVAAGGGNISMQRIAALVGNDGASLVGNDGASLIGNDGGTLVGNDGASLIGNDGGTLVGNDGASLIGNDGGTLVNRLAANMVAAGGLNLIGNDGATLIGNDGATLFGRGGANLAPRTAGALGLVNGGANLVGGRSW